MSNKELSDSLSKTIKELMLKEPFYGLFLLTLQKEWSDVKTACVALRNLNYVLKIDPDFWESLSSNHRLGLLKHELLHIAFFHLTDYSHLVNHEIANIAMDLEINQYIDYNWLPEGGCTLDKFQELNLLPKQGTDYYYKELIKNADSSLAQAIQQALATGALIVDNGNNSFNLPDHEWTSEEINEATQRLANAQIQRLLEHAAEQVTKSRGILPGEIKSILERLQNVEPPKFDWRGYLRRFHGKSIKVYTRKSRRKYNKRLPDNPGLKLKQLKHVLVAIDTSGSVSTKELKEFLNEIYHINKTGSEITILQCDTAISYIGKFDPKKDFEIHGRGGTSFQPVIDYYNENMRKYSCLFYLTDGEAPSPDNCKGNVLWVLSHQSTFNSSLPGNTIQLN